MSNTLSAKFAIGDMVRIDNDAAIVAKVASIVFDAPSVPPRYETVWFHNGTLVSTYVHEWRVSPSDTGKGS